MIRINLNDDRLLWNRFREGDKTAYRHIYYKYIHHLLSYGFQFTNDRELIKDCVQDVFIRIYNYRENMKPTDNIKIYLLVAMKNRLFTLLEDRHNNYESIEISEIPLLQEKSPDEKIITEEKTEILQKQLQYALNRLSEHQREAIHYRFMDNLSIQEISILVNMNPQSVQNLLQRSIKKMREYLKKDHFE